MTPPEDRLRTEAGRARGEARWLRAMADDARPLGVGLACRGRAQAAVYAMRAAEVYAAAADLAERYADALEVAAEHARAGRKPLPATPNDDLRETRPAEGGSEGPRNVSRYALCHVAA